MINALENGIAVENVVCNNGLTAGTPKTLNGAISAIGTKSTKIILLDGDYRQWVSLSSGYNVLVLHAQNPGNAATNDQQ